VNYFSILAIYRFEMGRTFRSPLQSIASPVVSTILYLIVFGAAIGGRVDSIDGVSYDLYIIPGLIMLTVMTQSVSNASFGIYFPKYLGTIYEPLSAPISHWEIIMGYVGAATTKSLLLGMIVFGVAYTVVDIELFSPVTMAVFLVLTAFGFSLLGFIVGIWAKNFEQLSLVPLLILNPLIFLGGSFYSIDMLPSHFGALTMFNPMLYLISGFKWTFFGNSDVSVFISLAAIMVFCTSLLMLARWIFITGYKLRP
jgi:ABC-2 type transport system permease protein